jgi:hypothetical protein
MDEQDFEKTLNQEKTTADTAHKEQEKQLNNKTMAEQQTIQAKLQQVVKITTSDIYEFSLPTVIEGQVEVNNINNSQDIYIVIENPDPESSITPTIILPPVASFKELFTAKIYVINKKTSCFITTAKVEKPQTPDYINNIGITEVDTNDIAFLSILDNGLWGCWISSNG